MHPAKGPLSFDSQSGQHRFSYTSVRGDCVRLFKWAKHIGTTDRMARLLDETFEMLIVAQYNIVRHGGVEAIDVRERFIRIAHTVPDSGP